MQMLVHSLHVIVVIFTITAYCYRSMAYLSGLTSYMQSREAVCKIWLVLWQCLDKSHVHAGCAKWAAEYQSQSELHSRIVSAAAANKACV